MLQAIIKCLKLCLWSVVLTVFMATKHQVCGTDICAKKSLFSLFRNWFWEDLVLQRWQTSFSPCFFLYNLMLLIEVCQKKQCAYLCKGLVIGTSSTTFFSETRDDYLFCVLWVSLLSIKMWCSRFWVCRSTSRHPTLQTDCNLLLKSTSHLLWQTDREVNEKRTQSFGILVTELKWALE